MRLLSNLHVKGKPAVLPDRAIRSQSHYFICRPCMLMIFLYLYLTNPSQSYLLMTQASLLQIVMRPNLSLILMRYLLK